MNEYEGTFILKPELGDEKLKETMTRVEEVVSKNGGEVESREEWGKKKLAYRIAKHSDGFYVLINFKAPPREIPTLNRTYRMDDAILRHNIYRRE